jgi:hypothetical protein
VKEFSVVYRIQLKKGKDWVFVCEACCLVAKKLPEYRYGGTWKGRKNLNY